MSLTYKGEEYKVLLFKYANNGRLGLCLIPPTASDASSTAIIQVSSNFPNVDIFDATKDFHIPQPPIFDQQILRELESQKIIADTSKRSYTTRYYPAEYKLLIPIPNKIPHQLDALCLYFKNKKPSF
jgi:hypothetical protein